jgi:diacylglycerol O-acyltransferase
MATRRHALTAADGAWWQMEQPTNLMTITAVFTFREHTPIAVMRRLVEERLMKFDRFRQRVVRPAALARPHWEDDPAFDLDQHLRLADLEGDVDQETLQQYVGELMSTPLPKDRPLWQFHHVERYGGGSALVARVHHCIADGMSLVQVLLHLADEKPSFVVPKKRLTREQQQEAGGPLPPNRVVDAFKATGGLAKAIARVLDLRADPRTPFRGKLGREKLAIWSRPIPLDDVRAIGKQVGATLNDVLLSAVSGALKHYIEHRGHTADGLTLRAVVPVNLRAHDDIALGNKFGMVFLPLPVGGRSALDRLHLTKRAMDAIKKSPEAVVIFGLLRALGAAAMSLIETAVNLLGRKATAVMTNVPGPREPVRFFGAEVDSMMFWVPQSGKLGMGVSILSYCGQVRVGLAVDRNLVPDPHVIVDGFHRAIDELASATPQLPRASGRSHARQG